MKRPLKNIGGRIMNADGHDVGRTALVGDAARLVAAFNDYPELFSALDDLVKRADVVEKGLDDYGLVILAGERAYLKAALDRAKGLLP